MRITGQRAISSKVSADGIGVFNAMAEVREWWGLRSGAKVVRECFIGHESYSNSAAGHEAGVLAYSRPLNNLNVIRTYMTTADHLLLTANRRRANILFSDISLIWTALRISSGVVWY